MIRVLNNCLKCALLILSSTLYVCCREFRPSVSKRRKSCHFSLCSTVCLVVSRGFSVRSAPVFSVVDH